MNVGFPSTAVWFKSDIRLSYLDYSVAAIWEAFCDEQSDASPGTVVMSVQRVDCGEKYESNVSEMPSSWCLRREQRGMVLFSIQYSIGRAGLPVPDNCLNVLCIVKRRSRYYVWLIEIQELWCRLCSPWNVLLQRARIGRIGWRLEFLRHFKKFPNFGHL